MTHRLRVSAVLAAGVFVALVPVVGVHPASAGPNAFAAPPGATGPDDLTLLNDVVWVGYQNGIGADGSPSSSGATESTVAGFTPAGTPTGPEFSISGKIDGLAADPANDRLIATVNEDLNSALYVLTPSDGSAVRYSYTPDPSRQTTPGSAKGGRAGGTDSVSIKDGVIWLAHSNPAGASSTPPTYDDPTEYQAILNPESHTANLKSAWKNDASATDAISGSPVQLQLTDPDSNLVMPAAGSRYSGQLAQISQGDGVAVFADGLPDHPVLTELSLTDGTSSPPSVDGMAVATAPAGTLLVVDRAHDTIVSMPRTDPTGTVYVSEDNGSNNALVGTLDLSSGVITPIITGGNPKGVLFVPSPR